MNTKSMKSVQKPKKSIKNFVQVKSITTLDPTKVAIGASVGLFFGAVAGILSQIAKIDFKGEGELDPPAPNMEELEPDLVSLYKRFMGPFYRLCPERNKQQFYNQVKESIEEAEALMLIENQLIRKEVDRTPDQRNQAVAHARTAVAALRKVEQFYDSEVVENVKDTIDVILLNVMNHVGNVRVLTSIF